jgi:2-dehydropantoate 2-reductase
VPSEPLPTSEPPAPSAWPRVCVFGAGAVGCYFGARLALAGAPVTLVARPAPAAAIEERGLLFEAGGSTRSVAVRAHAGPEVVRDADLVLFCVKARDTEAGARLIAPLLRAGAQVVSLQNGVDNAARMRAAAGLDPLAAVVYVACSMAGPGHVRHAGRGDLVLGEALAPPAGGTREAGRAAAIAAVFERAGVPCPLSPDVRADLWVKLVINCAFNAISALGGARYGRMVADPAVREVMRDLIAECVAVARADGVALPAVDELHRNAMGIGDAMGPATSSTAQDLAAGRATEIDALNGYVAARGAALGVAAPVNRALWTLVRLVEARGA